MLKATIKTACLLVFLINSILGFGCQNKKSTNRQEIKETPPQTKKVREVKNLFYNVPSPIEVSEIIKRMKLSYYPDLMNPVSNADNYLSQSDIAINIGVYGADLSYIRIYEQFQDAARYLAVIKKFTRELGIPEEQEKQTARRLEENIENQDSLLNIISETFTKSDSYLKENQRGGTAALIILGGWIETLYLATNITDVDQPQEDMVNLISQQKHSVKNLIGLLSQFRNNEKVEQMLPELKKLDAKFQEIKTEKKSPARVKTKNGKTVIQNKVTLTTSHQVIKDIRDINNGIRAKITEL